MTTAERIDFSDRPGHLKTEKHGYAAVAAEDAPDHPLHRAG
jgi:hypothetical protein